jgi:DNA repair protein MmcB-like
MKRVQPWTEHTVSKAIAQQVFGRAVLVVPQCGWTGYECDLLVIPKCLRIVDVEVKVSAADLRADINKQKWWHYRPWSRRHQQAERKQWPDKVWKHYYALPKEIWRDSMYAQVPEASGILLLHTSKTTGDVRVDCVRRAKPCREAKPITAADAIDLARLVSLRLWQHK